MYNPCTIINTGKHYSFYVKREVEGKHDRCKFFWNGNWYGNQLIVIANNFDLILSIASGRSLSEKLCNIIPSSERFNER